MKNLFVFFCAAVIITASITGCGKSANSQVSTPAEHDAFKGRQATPAELAAAMARAQSHQPPQHPK
jgi:predicted small lipoprotein YifL